MYLAELQTPNYQFFTIGDTEEKAIALMKKGWEKHIAGCEGCWKWEEVKEDVFVRFTRTGDIWRDGTLLHSYDNRNN